MRFSIITCTKNSAKYLAENIASVRAQSFTDYEHIFIDAFSADGTAEMIKKYQLEFPEQVKFFQFEPKGISAAMNAGTERAQGEFLIHLHSDDSFYDQRVLADAAEFLEKNPGLDWIYGRANTIRADGSPILVYPDKPLLHWHNSKSFIGRYLMKILRFVPHQAVFIRKSVLEKFGGFDESLTSEMDPDLWFRIRNKTNWSFFNRIICNYRMGEGAQSSAIDKREENRDNIRKVQKRYLNPVEYFLVDFLNKIREKRAKR
ncbi:MAG: glycosyltransferase [Patescibacteria group bacterium]|nr:glycosyltransferase [Patescibacteria group bacterium]